MNETERGHGPQQQRTTTRDDDDDARKKNPQQTAAVYYIHTHTRARARALTYDSEKSRVSMHLFTATTCLQIEHFLLLNFFRAHALPYCSDIGFY